MPKRLERPFAKKSHPFFWCTFFWCDLSLSPLSVQSPFGVQCSTLTARAKPEFGVGRGTGGSKTHWVYRIFFSSKCFIVTGGRVDGLTG